MNTKLIMKSKVKKQLFILLAFIVLALTSNAQVTLQTFQIGHDYLQSSNTLKVPNTAAATPFKFTIVTKRGVASSGGFVSGNCKISLYYTENQSSDSNIPDDPSSVLLKEASITSSNYKDDFATLKDLEASLPAGKSNGKLVVRFEFPDNQNINRVSYSSVRYSIYVVPPPVVISPISNNTISIQEETDGVNFPKIIGSTPIGGPGPFYSYEWQYKDNNGNFVSWPYRTQNLNEALFGKSTRRVVKSVSYISYSNEIILPRPPANNFSVIKTPIFDANGVLTGNKIKINLERPDPNVRFSITILGPDDPYKVKINSDYEFILPLYYSGTMNPDYEDSRNFSANVSLNTGNSAFIMPTWSSESDLYSYNP